MAFESRVSTRSLPTHLKFIINNPESVGIIDPVKRVMYNEDWRTITFFGTKFKFNIKYETGEELGQAWYAVCEEFKGKYVIAELIDESNLEDKEYTCTVRLSKASKSEGGKTFTANKGIISIN